MYETDLRRIQTFGLITVAVGALMMLSALLVGAVSIIGTRLTDAHWTDAVRFLAVLLTSFVLVGLGGDIQHASSTNATNRQGLRLDWTALLTCMAISFIAGLILYQPLAFVSALVGLGLLAIRPSVINLTSY